MNLNEFDGRGGGIRTPDPLVPNLGRECNLTRSGGPLRALDAVTRSHNGWRAAEFPTAVPTRHWRPLQLAFIAGRSSLEGG